MIERPTVRSAALLVCTYKRPQTFAKLMQSVATLKRPAELAFCLVIADNNPESAWSSYIEPAVAGLGIPVHYGHEPQAGYSNARNKAIDVALTTDAEVFLFSDDDMILDPDWLIGHLRSHRELGAEVVNGRIYGIRHRFEHGAKLEKCGAGNVSFNRRLVDPDGLGLRFDPAFNKLGMEDQAFFQAACARGVVIRQSDFPLIFNYYGRDAVPEDEIFNKIETTAAMHHNRVALARQEKGALVAGTLAAAGLVFGLKAAGLHLLSGLQRMAGKTEKARKSTLSSQKERMKMQARFSGFKGEVRSRQDVRRSDPVGTP